MNHMKKEQEEQIIKDALQGDQDALITLLESVQDQLFTLSLRMLGDIEDAKDASQEIVLKIITNLMSFQQKSRFSTWCYRIAINHLLQTKKGKFAHMPLDFEFYGNDIRYANPDIALGVIDDMTRKSLAEELKLSCTNVMLQCLKPQDRCIFILGAMFHVDSTIGGDLMDMSAENFRQHLSRSRRKVNAFLTEYCGLCSGVCDCEKRVPYAIGQGRIAQKEQPFKALKQLPQMTIEHVLEQMETMDALAQTFEDMPLFATQIPVQEFLHDVLNSDAMMHIQKA